MECDTKAMLTPCGHFCVNSNSKSCVQFSPVAQSCLTLHDPMDCSSPGLPVYHRLLEFTQTHVHGVGDAIQPSHPLSPPPVLLTSIFISIIYMCVCVCLCTGGAGGPGPPAGREAATWHLHVEVESLWVRAWSPMEPLDCDLWGTVTSPSQVLSWC